VVAHDVHKRVNRLGMLSCSEGALHAEVGEILEVGRVTTPENVHHLRRQLERRSFKAEASSWRSS